MFQFLFLPANLTWLFLLKEVEPPLDRKVIKFLTFDNLFCHYDIFFKDVLEWRRLSPFLAKITLVVLLLESIGLYLPLQGDFSLSFSSQVWFLMFETGLFLSQKCFRPDFARSIKEFRCLF